MVSGAYDDQVMMGVVITKAEERQKIPRSG